jgi:Ran GTPase-activating protein (RanGAP) involved in mRNA processing and transport
MSKTVGKSKSLAIIKPADYKDHDKSLQIAGLFKDEGEGVEKLLCNYINHVLHKSRYPSQTQVLVEQFADKFQESNFEEKLESIELFNIPYKSQISIQKSLIPAPSPAQKERFITIANRIKTKGGSLIQIKLTNEGIDDFLLNQLCTDLIYNTRLQYLILHNNVITDAGVKRLCIVLSRHPRLHTLWLGANKISDIGISDLAHLIFKNHSIKEINISNLWPSASWAKKEHELHPHITCIGAEYLSQALKKGSALTSLSLAEQRLRDDGAISLFQVLSICALRSLNLSGNKLTSGCCHCLRKALSSNSIMENLDLSKNSITDGGSIEISYGLMTNTFLLTLNLSYNLIGDEGMMILSHAEEKSHTLTSLFTVGNPGHDHRADASMLVTGVEAHGSRGSTSSIFINRDGMLSSPSFGRQLSGQAEDLLSAVAQAVESANQMISNPPVPVPERARCNSYNSSPFELSNRNLLSTLDLPAAENHLSQVTLNASQLGDQLVRTQANDSQEHLLDLRVATEDDPKKSRPYSMVKIGLDHRAERERVRMERQSAQYRKVLLYYFMWSYYYHLINAWLRVCSSSSIG